MSGRDVVIVGGGPVGVFQAILLAQAGLSVEVIERDPAPYGLPRAVHIDHEIARLLNGIGVWDRLEPLMRAGDGHIHFGADMGMIRFMSAAGQPRPFGYANDYFFDQPELETTLRQALAEHDHAALRLEHTVEEVSQDDDGAQVRLDDGSVLDARWVIGCDGARSTVRSSLGITLDDLNFEEPWLVVDAEVHGPIRFPDVWGVPEGANLQNLSCMMCNPERPATIVPGRGAHRRWEFMLLPGEDDAEMMRPDRVAAMVAPWIDDAPHEINRAATYRFHGLVAEEWRRGRVFLAGDAAHQTPPFFGQGLCHGFRDAAGLAWRMALVAKGVASQDIFETYQTERDAQVRHIVGAAVSAGRYICELDPEKAAERDRDLRSKAGIRTAAELIAPLRSPHIGEGAGARFINPQVTKDGQLLDEVCGGGWRLFHRGETVPVDTSDHLDLLGGRVVDLGGLADPQSHIAEWFAANEARFVLVRPDNYSALVTGDAGSLSERMNRLMQAMGANP